MGKNIIDPKPHVRLHPAVWSAMHAFTDRTGKPDAGMEKGFLLAGTVSEGGMVVDVTHTIIFPQTGTSVAVDFDTTHKNAGKFWPAVHGFLKANNVVIVGWAHYYSGGVHHSGHDDFTDDLLSHAAKDSSPIMLSMTWNADKAGIEGKLWVRAGDKEVQVSMDDVPFEYVFDSTVVDQFTAAVAEKITLKVHVNLGDGINLSFPAERLDLVTEELIQEVLHDIKDHTADYLAIKEQDTGSKLWKALRTHGVDPAIVKHTHEQLDKLWSLGKTGGMVVRDFRPTLQPAGPTGKRSGATPSTEPKLVLDSCVIDSDMNDVYLVLTEDEANELEDDGVVLALIDATLVILHNDKEKNKVMRAIETGEWSMNTAYLKRDGIKHGNEFIAETFRRGSQLSLIEYHH